MSWHLPLGTKENHEKLQVSWCPGRELNQVRPECKCTGLPCSSSIVYNILFSSSGAIPCVRTHGRTHWASWAVLPTHPSRFRFRPAWGWVCLRVETQWSSWEFCSAMSVSSLHFYARVPSRRCLSPLNYKLQRPVLTLMFLTLSVEIKLNNVWDFMTFLVLLKMTVPRFMWLFFTFFF
jgi:hypothetical protein